jgi:hypothetical protein
MGCGGGEAWVGKVTVRAERVSGPALGRLGRQTRGGRGGGGAALWAASFWGHSYSSSLGGALSESSARLTRLLRCGAVVAVRWATLILARCR